MMPPDYSGMAKTVALGGVILIVIIAVSFFGIGFACGS